MCKQIIKAKIFSLALLLTGFNLSVFGAVDMFIKFDGVDGESKDKEHEGWIDVLSISWGVEIPRDAASGLPTGKRQHKPLTAVKELDKSSTKLLSIINNGGGIPAGTVHLVRFDPTGAREHYFTLELEEISISSLSTGIECGSLDRPTESLTLNFSKFKTIYEPTGTSSEDWNTASVEEFKESEFDLQFDGKTSIYSLADGQILDGAIFGINGGFVKRVEYSGPASLRSFDLSSNLYLLKLRLDDRTGAARQITVPIIAP